MKEKVINKLKNRIIVITMLMVFAIFWPMNHNLAYVMTIYTGLFMAFVYCLINIINASRRKTDIPISSVLIVTVYVLLLLMPTFKLYRDLPDYFRRNLLVAEGKIEEIKYRRGYLEVYIDNECISFWVPSTSFKNYPDDGRFKITYLPSSKHGLSYELIKE